MATRTLTPLQRACRAAVLFFAWDLYAATRAINRHYPDAHDNCAACSGRSMVAWPCLTHTLATTAYELMYAIPEPRSSR